MAKTLTEPDAERFVIELLRMRGPMTTREIEEIAQKEGKRCPDETVLFLTKLRSKGIIKGEISEERRGWVWSI
ncbi:MAG TPA: hypothetical protein ENN25_04775 [Euryarchaeota archaeon]|nr:hypothetical protein [Euryarchaeota archaeon]